eukprot:CAMPEP_0170737202 /NCGR_PEP_ID=MMETSP0437-20130122/4005_1 /TAXON_ID=0 /ORGANISM="Sexangularia sp." /LENGTH=263 /DNA_ID=CAMNT_0011075581 /DNA_START=81 /DNA_END=872 /DNA_ORIENTATION=-
MGKKKVKKGKGSSAVATHDYLAELTDAEKQVVVQLQEKGNELVGEDAALSSWFSIVTALRYARARNFDLDAAYSMLKETIEWRRETRPDQLSRDRDPVLESIHSLYTMFPNGTDNQGHPIMVVVPGGVNPHSPEERVRFLMFTLEEISARLDGNTGVTRLRWIIDFTHYGDRGRSAGGVTVARNSLNILMNHHPDRLHSMHLINTPWYFSMLYTVLSPLMAQNTKDKLVWFSGTDEQVKEHLLEYVDEPQLDEHFGGGLPSPT